MSVAATEGKANVLVVDDRPDKLLAFQTILEELDENVFVASSGDEALKLVLEQDFAVILMDVNMPGMDGIEAASLIRQRKRSARVPIIFVTAYADEMNTAQGYSLGAVDYIMSPVLPQVLRTKVRVLCDLYKMTVAAQRQGEERVALVKAEAARAAAEEEGRRSVFLAQAGKALASSLEFKTTIKKLVCLGVSALADLGAVVVINESQQIDWIEVAEPDGMGSVTSSTLQEPLPERLAQGVARALTTHTTELITWVAHEISSGSNDADRGLDGRLIAAAFIPLITSSREARSASRVLAILCLAIKGHGRIFNRADVSLAEELAARGSVALDNAILYERLREADRKKSEFLAALAHELRNPLSPIGNAINILRVAGDDAEKRARYLDVLERQQKQLSRLVSDLLDFSRISRGEIRFQFERMDVGSIVSTAVEAILPLTNSRGQELTVSLPQEDLRVSADSTRIVQVLSNLLHNAAKFTPEGGRISLSADREGSQLVFRVRDNGVGITAEMLPNIFDLFMQGESGFSNPDRGLGIGLTLAQRLVEAHGGTVKALSAGLNLGSEFVVALPLLEVAEPSHPGVESLPSRDPRMPFGTCVLVVDDNPDVAETTAMVLELEGCEVHVATDGPSALRAVEEFKPELVLLDIGLPGMDGYQVARRIRELPNGQKLRLIAVSGYGRAEDVARSSDAGFDRHLVKPLEVTGLGKILKELSPESVVVTDQG